MCMCMPYAHVLIDCLTIVCRPSWSAQKSNTAQHTRAAVRHWQARANAIQQPPWRTAQYARLLGQLTSRVVSFDAGLEGLASFDGSGVAGLVMPRCLLLNVRYE